MRALLLAVAGACLASPLSAADLSGTWRMSAEGKTALLLTVRHEGQRWSADVRRAEGMEIDDGLLISGMKPTSSERTLAATRVKADSLELKFAPPRPGEDQLRLLVEQVDDGHAQLSFAVGGVKSRPIALLRSSSSDKVATDWEARTYAIDAPWPDNAEMQRLFAEDQADRADPASIDWSVVTPRDEARRARTRALLDGGKLRSAGDYYAAAFVFQHGDKPGDFLLAHSLAVAAAARGERQATWIAAATLDRYLQNIGQAQIYGTQFKARKGEKATQGEYDRTLVPDALRDALGVPSLAEQEVQRRAWEERMNAKP